MPETQNRLAALTDEMLEEICRRWWSAYKPFRCTYEWDELAEVDDPRLPGMRKAIRVALEAYEDELEQARVQKGVRYDAPAVAVGGAAEGVSGA